MKTRIFSLIFALILALSFAGCSGDNTDAASSAASTAVSSAASDVTEIGEGSTSFTFEVVTDDSTTRFLVHTNETTVGAALLGVDLIAGDTSDYGLYVTEVNGITADYTADQAYWAFYVDGEYADKGVDQTEIEEGKTYRFTHTTV